MRILAEHRVAILLHEALRSDLGKTGLTYLRYGQATVVALIDHQFAGESASQLTGINKEVPIVNNVTEALPYNPNILLIGIAPSGGSLPENWWQDIKQAVEKGLSVVNGLHVPMSLIFSNLKPGQWIWDIRQEPKNLRIATGKASSLPGKRLLTVGTYKGISKLSTALELYRAAQQQEIESLFLATGPAGLAIAGDGVPLDAVRVDFAAGAVEKMILDFADEYFLLIIEGQGSLFHPGSTATLPLIRGCQPTDLVLVHRAGQKHLLDFPDIPIPPLTEAIELHENLASAGGIFREVKVKGIALDTTHLSQVNAEEQIKTVTEETGLPCTDVVRFGAEQLLSQVMSVL